MEFDKYTDELIANVRSTDGVLGLILVGSTTSERSSARDRWSDHDFYAVLSEGEEQRLREQLPFLPFRNDVATIAHDGAIGVSVLYRDGHLLEFAAATAAKLNQFRLGDHEIVHGAKDIHLLVASAVHRGRVEKPLVAADQVSLALIKLMVGVGRARRGELVNGGSFVRTYAIGHLAAAVLARIPYEIAPTRDGLDPERRFEECYPSTAVPWGWLSTSLSSRRHARCMGSHGRRWNRVGLTSLRLQRMSWRINSVGFPDRRHLWTCLGFAGANRSGSSPTSLTERL